MAKSKQVVVNFFRVAYDNEKRQGHRVHELLQRISNYPANKRVKLSGDDSLMLGEYVNHKSYDETPEPYWFGQLRRVRPNDRVAEGNEDGYYDDAPFVHGSATEAGYFLVLPEYKAILYVGSPLECGWTQLHHYLQRFSDEDEQLHFLPILDQEKIKLLDKMIVRSKISMKVADPQRWSLENRSLADELRPGVKYGADWLRIEAGVTRGEGKSLLKRAVDMIKQAATTAKSSETMLPLMKELRIEGYTDGTSGQERVSIDFIKDRVQHKDRIDMSNIKTIHEWKSKCYVTLTHALDAGKKQIRDSFDSSND